MLPDSISEKLRVHINGVEQGMFVRGTDATKPVLLYLHGGMPEYFLSQRHPTRLEDEFVVCWWEQRGAGLSYRPGMSPESVTVGQLVDDTLALTNELRRRFRKDRIYLMGHSGGSFLGMHAVARAPQCYHAYVGVAQMAHQLRSERRAYDYMLARCRAERRTRLARRLEAVPVTLEGGVPPSAPLKGFYTFEQSAHSPVFEEPGKVMTILREDVLNGANRLADKT